MAELTKAPFDVATFLEKAGLGRRIIQLKPKHAFFSQGNAAFSIFRRAAQNSLSYRKTGKKPQSRFSPLATSWERSRSQPWAACA
jgi:hypothetical protein